MICFDLFYMVMDRINLVRAYEINNEVKQGREMRDPGMRFFDGGSRLMHTLGCNGLAVAVRSQCHSISTSDQKSRMKTRTATNTAVYVWRMQYGN